MNSLKKWTILAMAAAAVVLVMANLARASLHYFSVHVLQSYGFIDTSGKLVLNLFDIHCKGTPVLSDGLFVLKGEKRDNTNSYYAIFNRSGLELAKNLPFQDFGEFHDGWAAAIPADSEPNAQFSLFIDKLGQSMASPNYSKVRPFSEGFAAVQLTGEHLWRFVDSSGNKLGAQAYSDLGNFSEGLASVKLNNKWGVIDRTGMFVIQPFSKCRIEPFHDSLAAICDPANSAIVYIDKKGNVVLTLARKFATETSTFRVSSDFKTFSTIEKPDGKLLFQCSADNTACSDGKVIFEKDGLYGFKTIDGKVVVAAKYEYCWPFRDGMAMIFQKTSQGGRFGFIDQGGKQIVESKYCRATSYSDGFALVSGNCKSDNSIYIDRTGTNIFRREYKFAQPFHEGLAFIGHETGFFSFR